MHSTWYSGENRKEERESDQSVDEVLEVEREATVFIEFNVSYGARSFMEAMIWRLSDDRLSRGTRVSSLHLCIPARTFTELFIHSIHETTVSTPFTNHKTSNSGLKYGPVPLKLRGEVVQTQDIYTSTPFMSTTKTTISLLHPLRAFAPP